MKTKFFFTILALVLISFTSCGLVLSQSPAYAVKDMLLQDKIGRMKQPNSNPQYEGGIEELKKYFAAHPLQNPDVEGVAFRVHIYFLVDAEGNAKYFDLVTKVDPRTPQKKMLADWGLETLEIVSQMPQRWIPAYVNGQPVDCYQVLSFTVVSGKLDKTVSYR